MRNISILIFVGAIILGAISVLMTRSYINSQRVKPAVAALEAPEQEVGTLVVAAGPLNFGDEITAEMLREVPWPEGEDVRPENSFSEISEVMLGTRRVAIRSIAKNEPVVQNKISGFGYRATLSQVVDPDMRAVAVSVTDVTGVAGFVLPGDRVDVVYTRDERNRANEARIAESKLLVRDVRVLAVDQIADESTEGAVVAKAATLEVSTEQAQKISLASRVGELDLLLRPMVARGSVIDANSDTIEIADLVNDNRLGEKLEETPQISPRRYRPVSRRTRVAAAPKPDPNATMRITRGVETSESEVVREATIAADGTERLAGGVRSSVGTTAVLLSGPAPNP